MVRIRHGWLVAALALSVSAGACKKNEKKADPAAAPTAKAGEKPAEKPAAGGGTATASVGGDDLSLLPVNSEMVMGLNFQQLQGSALWKKFVEPQLLKGDAQQKLGEFKAKCGFDPMTAITSVSVGMNQLESGKPDGVVVVHGPEKGKVMGCLDQIKEEAAKDGTTISNENGVVTIKDKDGEGVYLTYVNDTTALVVIGPGASPATLAAAAKGDSALKTSPQFVDMYGKIKTSDSLWLLMNGKSKAFDQARGMGFSPVAVFGSVNVTDGLGVDMRIRLESADKATEIVNMAKGQLDPIKAMVDKVEVSADGADAKFVVAVSATKLESLISQFGGMLGGM